jgi:HK97 family phage prohead protease
MAEKKEFLAFKFKVEKAEADDNTGYVKGFASTFGNVDFGQDVVVQGAFAKTISDKKGKFPILLDHDPCQPAGYNVKADETSDGLYVEGEIKLFDPRVRQRYELAKLSLEQGCPMGFSIGYSAVKWEYEERGDQGDTMMVRLLKEVRLWEYSLVTFPMNPEAGVTGAKAEAWAALFARLQNGPYDLDRVQKALDALDQDAGQDRAAKDEADPELLQSVDRLIARMRG